MVGAPGAAPGTPEAPEIASGLGVIGALAASDCAVDVRPAADSPTAAAAEVCPASRVGSAEGAAGASGNAVWPPAAPAAPDAGSPLAPGGTGIGPSGYSPRTEKPVDSCETADAATESATTCARNRSRSRPRTPICVPNTANSPDNREISAGSIDVVMSPMLISRAHRNMSRNHWYSSGIYSNPICATESPSTKMRTAAALYAAVHRNPHPVVAGGGRR